MKSDDIISTLNDLTETCTDSEALFKVCAADASDRHPDLKKMLADRQFDYAAAASELRELVFAEGGQPETGSSMAGALHRRWVDLKKAIAGLDDEAVLNECERAEDSAARSYQKALETDLPAPIRLVVEREYQGVLRNYGTISELRDQIRINA